MGMDHVVKILEGALDIPMPLNPIQYFTGGVFLFWISWI